MIVGKIEDALLAPDLRKLRGRVNLIVTSPPFPLVRKKKYGDESGDKYVSWLSQLAPQLAELLADDGSIVIEVGNAWTKGHPTMSTLPIEALLAFKDAANLHLCQHIICHNPARLPSPARRLRPRKNKAPGSEPLGRLRVGIRGIPKNLGCDESNRPPAIVTKSSCPLTGRLLR